MTVLTEDNEVHYTGNGSTNSFAFNFITTEVAHIKVFIDRTEITSGFTVTLNADQTTTPGGIVVFDIAPAPGDLLVIARIVPFTQLIDYTPYDAFPAETHEGGLDKLTMMIQQLNNDLQDGTGGYLLIPGNPGEYLIFNPDGSKTLIGSDLGDIEDAIARAEAAADRSEAAFIEFRGVYHEASFIPPTENVNEGDLWYDLSTDPSESSPLKVYDGTQWADITSRFTGDYRQHNNVGGQTVFDIDYDPGFPFVFVVVGGAQLVNGIEFTFTNDGAGQTQIVLNDPIPDDATWITLLAFQPFEVANHPTWLQANNTYLIKDDIQGDGMIGPLSLNQILAPSDDVHAMRKMDVDNRFAEDPNDGNINAGKAPTLDADGLIGLDWIDIQGPGDGFDSRYVIKDDIAGDSMIGPLTLNQTSNPNTPNEAIRLQDLQGSFANNPAGGATNAGKAPVLEADGSLSTDWFMADGELEDRFLIKDDSDGDTMLGPIFLNQAAPPQAPNEAIRKQDLDVSFADDPGLGNQNAGKAPQLQASGFLHSDFLEIDGLKPLALFNPLLPEPPLQDSLERPYTFIITWEDGEEGAPPPGGRVTYDFGAGRTDDLGRDNLLFYVADGNVLNPFPGVTTITNLSWYIEDDTTSLGYRITGHPDGAIGDLIPKSISGLNAYTVLQDVGGAFTVELGGLGADQIPDSTELSITFEGFANNPVAVPWNAGNNRYQITDSTLEQHIIDWATPPPIQDGLTVGYNGTDLYGFAEGSQGLGTFGDLVPSTINGFEVLTFASSISAGDSILNLGQQIPGVLTIRVTYEGFAGNPVDFDWTGAWYSHGVNDPLITHLTDWYANTPDVAMAMVFDPIADIGFDNQLTVGTDGNVLYGFRPSDHSVNSFGDLVPDTIGGIRVFQFTANSNLDAMRIMMGVNSDEQIPGIGTIEVTHEGYANNPVEYIWEPTQNRYENNNNPTLTQHFVDWYTNTPGDQMGIGVDLIPDSSFSYGFTVGIDGTTRGFRSANHGAGQFGDIEPLFIGGLEFYRFNFGVGSNSWILDLGVSGSEQIPGVNVISASFEGYHSNPVEFTFATAWYVLTDPALSQYFIDWSDNTPSIPMGMNLNSIPAAQVFATHPMSISIDDGVIRPPSDLLVDGWHQVETDLGDGVGFLPLDGSDQMLGKLMLQSDDEWNNYGVDHAVTKQALEDRFGDISNNYLRTDGSNNMQADIDIVSPNASVVLRGSSGANAVEVLFNIGGNTWGNVSVPDVTKGLYIQKQDGNGNARTQIVLQDTAISFIVPNGGDFFFNDQITVNGNVTADDPILSAHLATKNYVDSNTGGGAFLPLDGSEQMTGLLQLNQEDEWDNYGDDHAVTKQAIIDRMQTLLSDVAEILEGTYLKLDGEFPMIGDLRIESFDPKILLDDNAGTGTASIEFKMLGDHIAQIQASIQDGLTLRTYDFGGEVDLQLQMLNNAFEFIGGNLKVISADASNNNFTATDTNSNPSAGYRIQHGAVTVARWYEGAGSLYLEHNNAAGALQTWLQLTDAGTFVRGGPLTVSDGALTAVSISSQGAITAVGTITANILTANASINGNNLVLVQGAALGNNLTINSAQPFVVLDSSSSTSGFTMRLNGVNSGDLVATSDDQVRLRKYNSAGNITTELTLTNAAFLFNGGPIDSAEGFKTFAAPVADNDIPNKAYVDFVAGGTTGIGNGFINYANFDGFLPLDLSLHSFLKTHNSSNNNATVVTLLNDANAGDNDSFYWRSTGAPVHRIEGVGNWLDDAATSYTPTLGTENFISFRSIRIVRAPVGWPSGVRWIVDMDYFKERGI